MHDNPEMPEYEKIGEIVSIYQRGNKWYVNFQVDCQQKRQSLKTSSKKEARRRALQIERDLITGEYKTPKKAPTLDSVVTQYTAYLTGESRAQKTLTKYKKVFEQLVDLASRKHRRNILGVDLALMDAYRQERAAAGRSAKTIYGESVIIRQLVNFAMTRQLIATDPLKGVKIREPKPTPQPCWTPDEVERILAAAREPQRTCFTILADTGMRIGELKWLTWDDVDVVRKVLLIRPKEGWKPKTGDQRAVPIPERVIRLLASLPRRSRWVVTAGRSARHPEGDGQVSERRLLRSLKRTLTGLGLEGHLHTFRHAFISRALAAGIPESQVRAWVGHVDEGIIKLYTHIADSQSQASMKKLSLSNGSVSSSNHKEVAHVDETTNKAKAAQNQYNPGETSDGLDAK